MVVQERKKGKGHGTRSSQCRELASGLDGLLALSCGFLESVCRYFHLSWTLEEGQGHSQIVISLNVGIGKGFVLH